MEFTINNPNETPITMARKLGYRMMGEENGEYNMARSFSQQNYPRFHIYFRKNENNDFKMSLHLDQKQASYQGSSAHSGEYDGPLVEQEARRIMTAGKFYANLDL